jgi:hypothetical protein
MFDELLATIARRLDEHGIPYMVIGGQAVLLYGEPRLTEDIDITLGVAVDALELVMRAVSAAGLTFLVDPSTFTPRTLVLPCKDPETEIRVDFIFSLLPYERQAIERGRDVLLAETSVRFVSPEDLIIHKLVAARPRDIEDVRNVLLMNPSLDVTYIRQWLADFEETIERPVVAQLEELLRETQ